MAITRKALWRRVAAEISAARPDKMKPVRSDDYERVLAATLHETALDAWMDPDLRAYVTSETPIALDFVDGVAEVDGDAFLVECLTMDPLATIKHPDYTDPFDYIRNYQDAIGDESRTPGEAGYAVEGQKVVTYVGGAGAGVVQGTALVYNAAVVPTVAIDNTGTLHRRLEPLLVANLVNKLNRRPPRSGGGA